MTVGCKAARTIIGAVLVDLAMCPLFAWNLFATSFAHRLGVEGASLTLVYSVGLACFTVGVLAGGYATDRIAPRRLAVLTAVGIVAGLLGAGAAGSLLMLIVTFGVVLGTSTGLGYATAVRVAGTVAGRRGTILGLVVGAYAAGTAILAPVAGVLLAATTLFMTFVALAAALGAVVVVAAVLLPSKTTVRTITKMPRPVRERRAFSVRGRVAGLTVMFGVGSAPTLTAFAHAGQVSGTATASAVAVSFLSGGNLAGRLVAGAASDRVGRPVALHSTAAILTMACVVLGIFDMTSVRLVMLLVLGVQYGALSALVPAATADTVPAQSFGTAYGTVFTGWGLAGLVVPVAAATVASQVGWNTVFLIFIAFAVLTWFIIAVTHGPVRIDAVGVTVNHDGPEKSCSLCPPTTLYPTVEAN